MNHEHLSEEELVLHYYGEEDGPGGRGGAWTSAPSAAPSTARCNVRST